ncbi:GntR family transcriptional regulator [uncultured Victivallis sp.]|uniref:GntR family transcriptional regulator n=1 Tax=uncultured Victivallis sp. TaxID=354118 RepID=UPI0025DA17F8|nr:GntR family transcriptional regulator [uncultured Victivallis sp.]
MLERKQSLKSVSPRLRSFTANGESRSVPKYELLKRALLDYIAKLPPDREFLPYEKELAVEFGVSRCTVTRALEKLRRSGYIETSKKSGSRVLRRSFPMQEKYREPMQNIAFLFANTVESTVRTTDSRWQLLDETERCFAADGVRTIAYNLRENDWQAWQDPEILAASLQQRGIRFAAFRPGDDRKFSWRAHLEVLLRHNIKVMLLFQASTELMIFSSLLLPGIDYLLVNNQAPLLQTLQTQFADFDHIFYLSNEAAAQWAEPRAKICHDFCEEHQIPFEHLRSSYLRLWDEDCRRLLPDIDEACTARFLEAASAGDKIACFCANDYSANSFITRLKQKGVNPDSYEIIGFDNRPEFRSLNLSTFDFDAPAQARALFECCEEFRRDPDAVLHRTRGIMTYARFINRRPEPIS